MEDKLKQIQRTLDDLKRQQDEMQRKLDNQQREIEKISKDLGSEDNKNFSDILYRMDGYLSRDMEGLQTMQREVQDTRRSTTNMELMLKEVMRGMSVIYNSVDELEDNVLPERQTK